MGSQSVVALIQARISSNRLPGKVLLPLGDCTVLDHVVRATQRFSDFVAVCTSTDPSDDAIEEHCQRAGIVCLRGSLTNVFERFRNALASPLVPDSTWFYRVTADCPLLSARLARSLLRHAEENEGLDHVCMQTDQAPLGITTELVRTATFESIEMSSLDDAEREHVTLCLYERPARYRSVRLPVPDEFRAAHLRLTLDYLEDYALLTAIYEKCVRFDVTTAMKLVQDHPALANNTGLAQKLARA